MWGIPHESQLASEDCIRFIDFSAYAVQARCSRMMWIRERAGGSIVTRNTNVETCALEHIAPVFRCASRWDHVTHSSDNASVGSFCTDLPTIIGLADA